MTMATITTALSGDLQSGVTGIGIAGVPGRGGNGPTEDLETFFSLNYLYLDEALLVHGPALPRSLPQETDGVCAAL